MRNKYKFKHIPKWTPHSNMNTILKVWKLRVDCLCVFKCSNFQTFKLSNFPTLKPCCFANFITLQKSKPHNLKSVTMESFLVPVPRPTNTYSWAKASTWRNPKSWAKTTFEISCWTQTQKILRTESSPSAKSTSSLKSSGFNDGWEFRCQASTFTST